MARLSWTPERLAQVRELWEAGHTYHEIREILSREWGMELTYGQIRNAMWLKGVRRCARSPQARMPRYDQYWHLSGDWVLIGDLHCPYVDWELAERVVETARRFHIRQLLICGDIFDFQTLSSYPLAHPPPSAEQEESIAREIFEMYTSWFKMVRILTGNHDLRLFKALQGALGDEAVIAALMARLAIEKRAEWSTYGYCLIETPTGIWRVTHPKNYSRVLLATAQRLAWKHHQHVIVFHEHATAVGLDNSGQYVIASVGCMADPVKLPWVQMTDTTAPVMTQAFAVLKEGKLWVMDKAGLLGK